MIARLKLTMRCFLWMLFLPGYFYKGSLDKPLSVTPKTLSAWEGSCVFISCNIKEEHRMQRINQWSFVWYFQPSFDKSLNDYSGTLLYSSNQTATEVSSEFSNRVQFVGDLGSKNCSLKISQLHLSDNGSYGIRLYWIPGELKTSDKWFEILEVIVHKTPSELIKTVSPEMIEGNNYTVACSIPYYCYDELIKLSIQGLEDHHVSPPKMTTEIQTVQTTFMATWKDHGKQLTCLLKTHDGREMKKSFANLTVKYCPKDVQLFHLNHLPIKEGDKVILNCSVGSSYPSNNNYKFFGSSGDILRSWGSTLIVFAIPAPITSYKCEACNSIGCTFSPTITWDVLYAPKDVQLVILNDLPIKEGDTITMNCSFGSSKPNDNWYNWFKSDPSTIEYKYSGPNVMTYPATHGPYNTSYECEVCNRVGCTASPVVTLEVFSSKH